MVTVLPVRTLILDDSTTFWITINDDVFECSVQTFFNETISIIFAHGCYVMGKYVGMFLYVF